MRTITTPKQMREWADAERSNGNTIGLVPTMGALHTGHMELVKSARQMADLVVVSIFVNPLQFKGQSDLATYPRPIDNDIEWCSSARVDVVYAPTAASMYPSGFQTHVSPGPLAEVMEGAARAGHFEGVATVVTKLLNAVLPHLAVFGEKDYQQLTIIRQMTADLDLGVEIVGHPIVRESDGLALSSRNTLLTRDQRKAATCLPRALDAAGAFAERPDSSIPEILRAAQEVIAAEPLANLDYLSVFDARTLQAITELTPERRRLGQVRIAGAVAFGDVRLIDNRDLFER